MVESSRTMKRKARETLEKYRKETSENIVKARTTVVSEKITPVKRCQNCYFCVGERMLGGSCWCQCSNPARSANVEHSGSWVKSKLILFCWKSSEE